MEPIEQPKTLVEETVGRIRQAIMNGELALGAKLSEQKLADMLGISRSPVHDALAALQAEGLVNISPKRGSFVFTPNPHDVDDLCEYRVVLEAAAIKLAIARDLRGLTKDLGSCIEDMREAVKKGDAARYTRADMRFHNTIIRRGGNRNLQMAYARAIGPVMALRNHLFTIMNEVLDRSLEEHTRILEACRSRDGEAAAARLEKHIGHLAEAFHAVPSHSAPADECEPVG